MENTVDVFVACIEVKPTGKSILDDDGIGGAWVRCYIAAASRTLALSRLRAALRDDGLELIGVEFCDSFFEADWESEDDGGDEAGVNSALETGDVVYGTFHTWPVDAPDAP